MHLEPADAGEGVSAAKSAAKSPAATALTTPGGGRIEVEAGGKPTWTCSVCFEPNAIEATICATCGAPFGRLLQEPKQRPEIKPQSAATWSLVWPGIGHWKAGYRADGIARMVLFAWTFGALMILLVARFGTGGLGPVFPLVALFLIAASAVYAISAIDAYRLAGGDAPLVTSRVLLWGSALLIVASVALASFLTLPAVRQ